MALLKRDEYKSILGSAIENMTEPEQAVAFLSQATEGADELYTTLESMTAENERLKATNKALAKQNAQLYLGKGVVTQDPDPTPEQPTITIKDLFDEKGHLK